MARFGGHVAASLAQGGVVDEGDESAEALVASGSSGGTRGADGG
jgi:hypothetical protein